MSEPQQSTPPPEPRPPQPAPEPPRPWRTEGLPPAPAAKSNRPKWSILAMLAVGYAVVFAILTVQDRLAAPEPVPYTEFKLQVGGKNVSELFARGDSIQGVLKKGVPVPGDTTRTYERRCV